MRLETWGKSKANDSDVIHPHLGKTLWRLLPKGPAGALRQAQRAFHNQLESKLWLDDLRVFPIPGADQPPASKSTTNNHDHAGQQGRYPRVAEQGRHARVGQ